MYPGDAPFPVIKMADATVVHADATVVTMIGALPTRLRAMAARAAASDRRADELVDVLDGGAAPQPLAQLYCLRSADDVTPRREYIGAALSPEELTLVDSGRRPVEVLASTLPAALRAAFSSVEAVPQPQQKEALVEPHGGTLVLFDSVAVPHQVEETLEGERVAIAGWLHEAQQPIPAWFPIPGLSSG